MLSHSKPDQNNSEAMPLISAAEQVCFSLCHMKSQLQVS